MRKIQQKKSQATMLSYILLVSIVIGMAVGVYAFLKLYVQEGSVPECDEDVSLVIRNYSYSETSETFIVTLENKGYFNIEGFFSKASNDSNKKPILPLNSKEMAAGTEGHRIMDQIGQGKYDFSLSTLENSLKPGETKTITFNLGAPDNPQILLIKQIQIQPYQMVEVEGKSSPQIALCTDSIILQSISETSAPSEDPEEDPELPTGYENLISWWKFNEATGSSTAVDSKSIIPKYNLDNLGETGFDTGKIGNALHTSLNGNSQTYAMLNPSPTPFKFTSDSYFSIELILKVNDFKINNFIFANYDSRDPTGLTQYYALFANNKKLVFRWNGNTIIETSDLVLNSDDFYYIVVTKSNQEFKLYVNGDLKETETFTISTPTYTDSYIGVGGSGVDLIIDELAVYETALTLKQIQQHKTNIDEDRDYFTSE